MQVRIRSFYCIFCYISNQFCHVLIRISSLYFRSGESAYENILQLEQLEQLKQSCSDEVDNEPRIQYANALNRERGDKNDNLGSSLRADLLL